MENKVVCITGSSGGIGQAMALAFGQAGYCVIIHYWGHEAKAKVLHDQIPGSCMYRADVRDATAVKAMFAWIKETYGRLDVLINNAGMTKDGLMLRMSEADFMDVIELNLKGTFLCSQQAIQIMMRQKFGSIINITSVVGLHGNVGQTNYAASKAGVIGLTKSLAKEMGSRNIRINAIAPGLIQTAMTDKLSDQQRQAIVRQIPLRHMGTGKDVAKAALFLASEDSAYISGQVLSVDGGLSM